MKQGRTLQELALEIDRQRNAKRDFIADTQALAMQEVEPDSGLDPNLLLGDDIVLGINDLAHSQIGEHLKIPKPYYDRMKAEAPDLLASNVNRWFQKYPAKRMIRTLDERARAFLSNAYRPLDNEDLVEAALPPLLESGVKVLSCEVTEKRLYLKVVDQRIERDLPTGVELGKGHHRFDTVSPALVISNSEVGYGALAVTGSVYTGGCTNLAVISERSTRKYHIGSKHDLGEEVYKMLSDNTRKLTDAALWAQIRDVVTAAFDQAKFDALVDKLAATVENKIEDPVGIVEVTAKRFGFNEDEKGSVLSNLIKGADLSQYGLHAAITRTAEDLESYDRASEFERMGGQIVELDRQEWSRLAEAA